MIINSKKFQRILNHLILISNDSTMRIHKHASALIKGGKIIETSVNSIRNRVAAHAEKMVMYKCKRSDLTHCTLFVIRVSNTQLSDSKPCKHCIEDIRAHGIRKVLYSTSNGGFELINTKFLTNTHTTCHYRSKSVNSSCVET